MNNFLSANEERRLVQEAQRGDMGARNTVIMNLYYAVCRVAKKRFAFHDDEREDAIQHVVTVLCEKFHKFDLQKNVRYLTYAHYWIRQSLQSYLEGKRLIRIPHYLQRSIRVPTQDLFRYQHLGDNAMKITTIEPVDEADRPRFQESLMSREREPSYHPELQEDRDKLKLLLRSLYKREREVVMRRSRGETLVQIALDLGLSNERVRQIEELAIQKLRNRAGMR